MAITISVSRFAAHVYRQNINPRTLSIQSKIVQKSRVHVRLTSKINTIHEALYNNPKYRVTCEKQC